MNDQGVVMTPDSRRYTCPSNETYRRLSAAIATQMARTFAKEPGVIGWQVDNEFTLASYPRCFCHSCRAGFQDWVKARYGTLDAVNAASGTSFWSQVYTDFSQIPVPLPSPAPARGGLKGRTFLLNHNAHDVSVECSGRYRDVLSSHPVSGPLPLPAYGVAVLLRV